MIGEIRKIAVVLLMFLTLGQIAFGQEGIVVGAERGAEYLPLLEGKKIGVVTNHTGRVGDMHLIDYLLAEGVDVVRVFAPEHGFRGSADAGEKVQNEVDPKTGLDVISLYGKRKKPAVQHIKDLDAVVFDIQDVGVRFYTYISTMHYAMEACAEQGKLFVVLDRPNPNGYYVSGPLLEPQFQSFVGIHPLPIVHGLTVGELAQMINGEGWLKGGMKVDLTVITCAGYHHSMHYALPIPPSPNLPNARSVQLYPSLGLFEGTEISVGRGTDFPFQVIGAPELAVGEFTFTPEPNEGAAYPPYKGKTCRGFDLRAAPRSVHTEKEPRLSLHWLKVCYENFEAERPFFKSNGFFDLLAGTDTLRKQIESGDDLSGIYKSWEAELIEYKKTRKRYLLYPDFE